MGHVPVPNPCLVYTLISRSYQMLGHADWTTGTWITRHNPELFMNLLAYKTHSAKIQGIAVNFGTHRGRFGYTLDQGTIVFGPRPHIDVQIPKKLTVLSGPTTEILLGSN